MSEDFGPLDQRIELVVLPILAERFREIDFRAHRLMERDEVQAQICIIVPRERLIEVMGVLRDEPRMRFEQLADLAGIDYRQFRGAKGRWAVVYSLLSLRHNYRLWVKVFLTEPDLHVPSVVELWKGANWPEREVYDMFGIIFDGHPDLRRILMAEDFKHHPLRKDYPLKGLGERSSLPVIGRDSA